MCVLSQGQYLMPLSLNCLPISSATPWWAIVSSNRSWLDWKRSPDPRQLPRFTLSNIFSPFLISLQHIFSFFCNILSHFLEFNGKRPQILKKNSATFLIIFIYLHIWYSRLYFCSRSYESLTTSYQSPCGVGNMQLRWLLKARDLPFTSSGKCHAFRTHRHLSEWIQGHDFIKVSGWH